MPVEVKELVIRASIEPEAEQQPAASAAPPSSADREAIIAAAVREVLRILRTSKER